MFQLFHKIKRSHWLSGELRYLSVRFLFLLAGLCIGLGACSDDADPLPVPDEPKGLEVLAFTDAINAKGLITAKTLDDQAELGITVVDAGDVSYGGVDYTNLCYRAAGVGESQTWSPVVGLGAQLTTVPGKVYAYYPYQEGASFTAIPLDATTDTDYMVATPFSPVNSLAPKANLLLRHVLAAVRLTVRKNAGFTGAGALTAVSVTSTAIGNRGSLDAKTGVVTVSDAGTVCSRTLSETLSTTGQDYDLLVVPTGTAADLNIALAIDDKSYEITVPSTIVSQGKVTCWKLTVGQSSLIIEGTTVSGWAVIKDEHNYVSGPSTVILNKGTVVGYNEVIDNTQYVAYRN